MTIHEFIKVNRVSMKVEGPFTNRPDNLMSDMVAGSSHWKLTLRRMGRRMVVWYSMGPAHTNDPALPEVLDCLASDASSIINANGFEDWARDFDYDPDSRKAERIYMACEGEYRRLVKFFDDKDLVNDLCFKIERL